MEEILNKRTYELSKIKEIIELILIAIGAFLVPLILPSLLQLIFGSTSFIATNSQIIVGSVVNTALIITALNVKGLKKILALVTLPSISAIAGGMIFGSLSIFMLYMLPAIWLGNLSLVFLIKYLYVNRNYKFIISTIIAILIKVAIIFAGLNILLGIALIPSGGMVETTLKYSMGLLQLITASAGGIISFGILRLGYKSKQ